MRRGRGAGRAPPRPSFPFEPRVCFLSGRRQRLRYGSPSCARCHRKWWSTLRYVCTHARYHFGFVFRTDSSPSSRSSSSIKQRSRWWRAHCRHSGDWLLSCGASRAPDSGGDRTSGISSAPARHRRQYSCLFVVAEPVNQDGCCLSSPLLVAPGGLPPPLRKKGHHHGGLTTPPPPPPPSSRFIRGRTR